MRKSLLAVTMFAVAVGGSTACATKGYVNRQVNQVGAKVDSLSTSLEETQERTRQNEARIGEVDTKAGNAMGSAERAGTAAATADGKAVAAADSARAAAAKVDEVEKATKRIVYEVVLSEAAGNFKFGAVELPDEAKASIDQMVTQLLANPRGAYFEIEGHTDNVGGKEVNERVGQERAEAVKLYLYEKHQIPLHRINVISYGEDKPASPNNTRDGRAQNRRVVIRVLA
jgi:outer membrane protein OmpA-like peptidoglycan-associated protein